jgi:hypothetical protein
MILQSHDRYNDIAIFDPESGAFAIYQKSASPLNVTRPIEGHFVEIHGDTVMFYRVQDQLHLRINELDFPLSESMFVHIQTGDTYNTLIILRDNNEIFAWKYHRPRITPPLELDPTPFVDEEDFDFGLYIQNVTIDQNRRNRVYRSD